jgi:hypothetical protein
VGLVVLDPVHVRAQAFPEQSFDSQNVDYLGSEEEVQSWSRVYPGLLPPAKEAFRRLATARVFAGSRVGLGGRLSPQGESFRRLLADAQAREAFEELAFSGRPYAQMYGLAGLRELDRERFDKVSRRFRFSAATVWTFSGCIVSEKKVSIVASELSEAYPQYDLARGQ